MISVDLLPERLRNKIDATDSCWAWTGAKTGNGYGNYYVSPNKWACAHTVVFESLVGPVPPDQELDHLCRNRSCVNPAHLEPVDHRTNVLRGEAAPAKLVLLTHCFRGHEFTSENTRIYRYKGKTSRYCRACNRINCRDRALLKRAA